MTSPHVVGDFHQPFDEASLATDDGVNVLTDQHIGVDGGAPDRARNHAIVLQDIQSAIHEQRNHVQIEPPRRANLGSETGNAGFDEGVVENTGIHGIVPDQRHGIEHHHRLDLRDAHVTDMKSGSVDARGARMEINRQIGIGPEQPIEHQAGVAAGGADALFVAGPFAVHVGQLQAPAHARPAPLHALHCRAGNV